MAKYLALDKLRNLFRILRQNGGITGTIFKIFRMDDAKWGCFIGEDKYGNKYYENRMYFLGRNRWVEFEDKEFLNYDATQVPAEWYGWLHYKTDLPPDEDPNRPKHPWMADHTENMTGTAGAFMPYSTTRPKVHPWVPPKAEPPKNDF